MFWFRDIRSIFFHRVLFVCLSSLLLLRPAIAQTNPAIHVDGSGEVAELFQADMADSNGKKHSVPEAVPEGPSLTNASPRHSPAFDLLRLQIPENIVINQEDLQPVDEVNNSIDLLSVPVAAHQYLSRHVHEEDSGIIPGTVPQPSKRGYSWKGLFAQSLFFNAVENSFRIADDDQIRYLLARKPFWHDYFASMKQFNMRRWNDGDDFLTNYVGHAMHGAVSSYIAIQNSPTGSQQEISATHEYWKSRFYGFLWSVAYSTQSEISPLGEAGIGNEGGWTYPINCHKPCPNWNPATMKYTNNTGWVDFIITPTVGTLWVLAEDTIDRYISDRIQGTNQVSIFPKILRGTLNPSRTMANAMRLKKPWYRDFQHSDLELNSRKGIHMLRSDDAPPEYTGIHRLSVAAHYRSMPFGSFDSPCLFCMSSHGGGFEADYLMAPWISVSVALDSQQGLSDKNTNQGGSALFAGFGVRLVHDRPHNAISFAIRPGMVMDNVKVPSRFDTKTETWTREYDYEVFHTAATLLLANDYKITKQFSFRSALGATIVRYRSPVSKDPPYLGKPPYLSWMSRENFTTHTTWVWQGGPVFRF